MWPQDYESRLRDWNDLRSRCDAAVDLQEVLTEINDWWFRAPMVNRHLHWHRRPEWPDAWQLLHDDIYCDLARALGIVYTIAMLDRWQIDQMELAQSDLGNLVLIQDGKYILNWCPGQLLNITSQPITILQRIGQEQLQIK